MTLEEVLNSLGTNIIKDAKSNLRRKKKIASGKLYDSLKYKLTDDKSSLEFDMEPYGYWIDQGRRKGPISREGSKSLAKWMKLKGIDSKYLFVIKRAIERRGWKPTYFFTIPYEQYTDNMDKLIDDYVNGLLEGLDDASIEAEMYGY